MITNFEEITCPLTEEEKKLVRPLIRGFASHTRANPIKARTILLQMKTYCAQKGLQKLTLPRLMKITNFIRAASILPLIATSKGYYVSRDPEEIRKQIDSLNERADSIKVAANGMKKFLEGAQITLEIPA